MTKIAFFGHDADDAAIRRRILALKDDGMAVTGLTMRRSEGGVDEWDNVDLGRTYDGAFIRRLGSIFSGARKAAANKAKWQDAELIYARNLDMLACAFLAKRYAKIKTPVVYECLDVHRLLVKQDPIGVVLRWLERRLLKRTIALIVSSPAFLKNHFEKYYPGDFRPFLIENRLSADAEYGPRPVGKGMCGDHFTVDRPLRIGWVGVLRCQRSFDLLTAIADQFGDRVEIILHGKPARTEISVFEPVIDQRSNMHFMGPYQAPEDLDRIYANVDVVWAGDFMEAGFNSVWLLPNRIYEGGYFGAPPIVVSQTETAEWVTGKHSGFEVKEHIEVNLPILISEILADAQRLNAVRGQLLQLPDDVFIQPKGMLAGIVSDITQNRAAS